MPHIDLTAEFSSDREMFTLLSGLYPHMTPARAALKLQLHGSLPMVYLSGFGHEIRHGRRSNEPSIGLSYDEAISQAFDLVSEEAIGLSNYDPQVYHKLIEPFRLAYGALNFDRLPTADFQPFARH